MRILTLSDHTADKASAAAARREAEYRAATTAYRSALSAREAHLDSHRKAVSEAWRNREIFSVVASVIRLGITHLSSKPRKPVLRDADRDEIVWASGNEGERKVATFLSTKLSDDWILVSGYKNAKGEIDQILLGPHGVFAIEIKYINGVVHCDGDRWWKDKYDRYGNLVETKTITDKRGRSPSTQLNDSADMLQSFLSERVNVSHVHRAIVLAHDSSSRGNIRNITVDHVVTINAFNLGKLFSLSSANLDSQAVERVLQAIRKDHDFWYKKKSRRERSASIQ
jgi:hypothetical protein